MWYQKNKKEKKGSSSPKFCFIFGLKYIEIIHLNFIIMIAPVKYLNKTKKNIDEKFKIFFFLFVDYYVLKIKGVKDV